MFKSRPEVVLLVYGKGGHTAQMERFLKNQPTTDTPKEYIALTNSNLSFSQVKEYFFLMEARNKYHWYVNVFIFMAYLLLATCQVFRIFMKYKVVGMISTGPGLAVIPGILCRLTGKKVVFFESWSRFFTPSIAGRLMHKIANLFFIQHKSIQKFYPKSKYMGRL